jgi:hypothetical protein
MSSVYIHNYTSSVLGLETQLILTRIDCRPFYRGEFCHVVFYLTAAQDLARLLQFCLLLGSHRGLRFFISGTLVPISCIPLLSTLRISLSVHCPLILNCLPAIPLLRCIYTVHILAVALTLSVIPACVSLRKQEHRQML